MLKKLINSLNSYELKSHLYKILFLSFCWFFFHKYISIAYMSIIIVLITYIISTRLNLRLDTDISFFHLMKYFLYLFKEIFFSTLRVTHIIWSKNCKISPKFDSITIKNKSELAITILANSITLTPGTVTIEIDKQNLLIHALEEESIDLIKSSQMDEKIKMVCR